MILSIDQTAMHREKWNGNYLKYNFCRRFDASVMASTVGCMRD
jgi:hypothetical protein